MRTIVMISACLVSSLLMSCQTSATARWRRFDGDIRRHCCRGQECPAVVMKTFLETQRPPEPQPTVAPCPAAVEFFVDGASPTATDDGPGSNAQPFKTIARGIRNFIRVTR